MAVTERLRGLGAWSVRLVETAPPSLLLDDLDLATAAFAHIIITPTHVDPSAVDVVTVSRFTGVYRSRPSWFELAGCGLAFWLADEDNKGDVIETPIIRTSATGTFVNWVSDLKPSSLDAGTVTHAGGAKAGRFHMIDRRTALDHICDQFVAEWRITPQGALDAGPVADLFVTTPTVVAMRRSGGRDSNVVGLPDPRLEQAIDAEDYTTRVVLLGNGHGATGGVGSANISPATGYRDLNGNLVDLTRIIDSSNTSPGNETVAAQAQLNRFTALRRDLTIGSDLYDIGGDLEPGDTIYVYDPERGLVDTTKQVNYRGELIFPMAIRCYGYTWPVQQGMGVYLRVQTGAGTFTTTDLTDWVEWETGTTSLEVGANPRALP